MAGKKWIILSTDGLNKEGEERRCMAKKIDKYCDQGFGYKENDVDSSKSFQIDRNILVKMFGF